MKRTTKVFVSTVYMACAYGVVVTLPKRCYEVKVLKKVKSKNKALDLMPRIKCFFVNIKDLKFAKKVWFSEHRRFPMDMFHFSFNPEFFYFYSSDVIK